MSNDGVFFGLYCLTLWIGYRSYVAIKAKAFNEGFKRGRASVQYVREKS